MDGISFVTPATWRAEHGSCNDPFFTKEEVEPQSLPDRLSGFGWETRKPSADLRLGRTTSAFPPSLATCLISAPVCPGALMRFSAEAFLK